MSYAEKFCATCGRLLRDCTCPIIINWADVSENDKLIAENEKLKEDRDLWKASEASCNRQYNELLDENEKLKSLSEQMYGALKEIVWLGESIPDESLECEIAKKAIKAYEVKE